jgi:hypothetical protein
MNRYSSSEFAELLHASELLAAAAALRDRYASDSARPLSIEEIERLEANGNRCGDWKKIRVGRGFDAADVSGSIFAGSCVIGAFPRKTVVVATGLSLPCGIYRSTIIDSKIGDGCLVCDSTVSRCVVGRGAIVFSVGEFSCSGAATFGNGTVAPVGIETGGRDIPLFSELTVGLASEVALRRGDRAFLAEYARFVKDYRRRGVLGFGYAGAGSVLRCSKRIRDVFCGPGAVISGANLVENASLLCSAPGETRVEEGVVVRNSCLQWGSRVSSMAIVENSLLAEHSCAERHAKITNSVIGPNSHIAEGEVTASLLGPFTALHHQSMLIGVLWPEGKGNVAAGANVGSNHTSRAPDQELWCGEGMFLGLGVNVKYPADFSRAPYTVIATGVTVPPQKMEFPFSLINAPSQRPEGMRHSLNELFPGWVLSNNVYAVLRNEIKFERRNRAKRSPVSFETFTPAAIDILIRGRDRLALVTETRPWYDASHIPGAGRNYISEQSRRTGIDAYNFFIEYYCLRGCVDALAAGGRASSLYTKKTHHSVWEHQRAILKKEGFAVRDVRENCERFVSLLDAIAKKVLRAKQKDDTRGRRIIDDYDAAHVPAARDDFVKETARRVALMKAEVGKLLSRL